MVNNFAHLTGGADQNCLGLVDALAARGNEVLLLATASPANVVHAGEFITSRVSHATRDKLSVVRQADVACRSLWNPEAARATGHLLRTFQPQVVHCHKLYPQLSVAPVLAASRLGFALVQTLHDYELMSASHVDHTSGWIDRYESRWQYRVLNTCTYLVRRKLHRPRIHEFVACSRYLAGRYRGSHGLNSTVIPYFVETSVADPLPFAKRAGAVFVGRLHPEKGVADVVGLAERIPSLKVTVVGHGLLESEVAEAARRLPNLAFRGRLSPSDVLIELRRSRLALMPSIWQEPGGIAALEAMSVGTPVVAYERGGLAEYVTDNHAGLIIPRESAALTNAVLALNDHEDLWRSCSQAGVKNVARRHSREAYVSQLEEVYLQATAASSGGSR